MKQFARPAILRLLKPTKLAYTVLAALGVTEVFMIPAQNLTLSVILENLKILSFLHTLSKLLLVAFSKKSTPTSNTMITGSL